MHADIIGRAASGCDNKVQNTEVLGVREVCGSVGVDMLVWMWGCNPHVACFLCLCRPVCGMV